MILCCTFYDEVIFIFNPIKRTKSTNANVNVQFGYYDLVQLIVFVQTIYIFPHDKQYFWIYIS